jgi:L-serine deaminase
LPTCGWTGLKVPRRAPGLFQALSESAGRDPLHVMDWVYLFALSVNEENAAGGRIVTAPTNGAAGIIPAVLHYYVWFVPGADEHNLGLTCDPIGGLVQIPCIERNAIASVKAVNAARLAINGDGSHKVSLDKAIKTMRDTGRDMKTKYKETARGGLAVNVIEC